MRVGFDNLIRCPTKALIFSGNLGHFYASTRNDRLTVTYGWVTLNITVLRSCFLHTKSIAQIYLSFLYFLC